MITGTLPFSSLEKANYFIQDKYISLCVLAEENRQREELKIPVKGTHGNILWIL